MTCEVIIGEPNEPTQEQIGLNAQQALLEAKTVKKAEIETVAYRIIAADIPYNGDLFQTNYSFPPPNDPREPLTVSFSNRMQLMEDNETVSWRTKSNIEIVLTKQEIREILAVFYDRQQAVNSRMWELKSNIDMLESIEEVYDSGSAMDAFLIP